MADNIIHQGLNTSRIEMLDNNNYLIWSMKMEALLEARQLFEDAISKTEPVISTNEDGSETEQSRKSWDNWSKKNKEAYGLIVLTLGSEQAIIYRGIKNAKEVWESIKKRQEGPIKDKRMDLLLEMSKIKIEARRNNRTVFNKSTRIISSVS